LHYFTPTATPSAVSPPPCTCSSRRRCCLSARLALLTPSVTAIRREVLPQMTPQLAVAPRWTLLLTAIPREIPPCPHTRALPHPHAPLRKPGRPDGQPAAPRPLHTHDTPTRNDYAARCLCVTSPKNLRNYTIYNNTAYSSDVCSQCNQSSQRIAASRGWPRGGVGPGPGIRGVNNAAFKAYMVL